MHNEWLIIDEISLVSANFLAEIDVHLRSVMSNVNAMKKNAVNLDRPFGGLNVLFVGDFFQLDPPTGTPINTLPIAWIKKARKYAPGPTEDHGQYLFWGKQEGCVEGVTCLEECVRLENEDEWLLQIQNEFRYGKVTEDTQELMIRS